jgi:hypothetical protein
MIPFLRSDHAWPPTDAAATKVVQATRLLRQYLEAASAPRRRLGKRRLLGLVNVAVLLLEDANLALGDLWDLLGQPPYQDAPQVDISEYQRKDKKTHDSEK